MNDSQLSEKQLLKIINQLHYIVKLYSFSVSVYAGSLGETAFVTHAPRKLLNNLLMTPFAEKKTMFPVKIQLKVYSAHKLFIKYIYQIRNSLDGLLKCTVSIMGNFMYMIACF